MRTQILRSRQRPCSGKARGTKSVPWLPGEETALERRVSGRRRSVFECVQSPEIAATTPETGFFRSRLENEECAIRKSYGKEMQLTAKYETKTKVYVIEKEVVTK